MSEEVLEKLDEMDGTLNKILNNQVEMQTTLYGAKHEKNGGLCSKVEKNSKKISEMGITIAKIAAAVGLLVSGAVAIVNKFLNG